MILSNLEIHKALDEGRLVIEPEPQPRMPSVENDKCPYGTHSVDLRLSEVIIIPGAGPFNIDFSTATKQSDFMHKNSNRLIITDDQPYVLKPGTFINGMTQEVVKLPIPDEGGTCLAARIEGKSSRARFGLLIHFTAPTVHPGFDGTLTLEMINLGPVPIVLTPKMPIAQLIVEEVKGLPFENPSQFQGQRTPGGGR